MPIFEGDKCSFVLLIKSSEDVDQGDAEKFSESLGNVLGKNNQAAEIKLEAENIDGQAARRVIFGKALLESARENIANLSSKSLAELKSYRVPPRVVHITLNAALYLFGADPKTVKVWGETVKVKNVDVAHNS